MGLPASVATTTLTGTLTSPDGTPATGTITLTPSSELRDAAARVVVTRQPWTLTLTAGGAIPATVLPSTEQQRLYPSMQTYAVRSDVDGVVDEYRITLPPGPVDWSTVVRALPGDGVWESLRGPEGPPGEPGPAGPPGAPGGLRTPEAYGAVGDGVADDAGPLQAWLNAGGPLHLPAGRVYRHHGLLTVGVDGTSITGGGTLLATDEEHSAVTVTGDDVAMDRVALACATTAGGRRGGITDHKLVLSECARTVLRSLRVGPSVGAGIFASGASDYHIDSCVVTGTLADSCHSTYGAHHGTWVGCEARDSGDDGFACVSYAGDGGRVVHDMLFRGCRVLTGGARGFSVVGGTDVTWEDCHAQDTAAAAFYVASEPSFATVDVARVTGRRLSSLRANRSATVDHGALFVWAGRAGTSLSEIRVDGLVARDTGTAPGIAGAEVWVWSDDGTLADVQTTGVLCLGTTAGELARDWSSGAWTVRDVGGVPAPPGWVLLAAADVYDVATTGAVALAAAAKQLRVLVAVDSTSAADTAAVRLNADTGAHYQSRFLVARASPVALEDQRYTAETSMRLSAVATAVDRQHEVMLGGDGYWWHPARIDSVHAARSASVAVDQDVAGWGEWAQNGAEITSVEVRTVGGATMDHCRMLVLGRDVP